MNKLNACLLISRRGTSEGDNPKLADSIRKTPLKLKGFWIDPKPLGLTKKERNRI